MEICRSVWVRQLIALAIQKLASSGACVTCIGNVTCNTRERVGQTDAIFYSGTIVLLLKQNGCAGAHARSFPWKISSLRPLGSGAHFRGLWITKRTSTSSIAMFFIYCYLHYSPSSSDISRPTLLNSMLLCRQIGNGIWCAVHSEKMTSECEESVKEEYEDLILHFFGPIRDDIDWHLHDFSEIEALKLRKCAESLKKNLDHFRVWSWFIFRVRIHKCCSGAFERKQTTQHYHQCFSRWWYSE